MDGLDFVFHPLQAIKCIFIYVFQILHSFRRLFRIVYPLIDDRRYCQHLFAFVTCILHHFAGSCSLPNRNSINELIQALWCSFYRWLISSSTKCKEKKLFTPSFYHSFHWASRSYHCFINANEYFICRRPAGNQCVICIYFCLYVLFGKVFGTIKEWNGRIFLDICFLSFFMDGLNKLYGI